MHKSPPPDPPKGFTIVEILIVIVVVGILDSVTVVAYTGIQQKAAEARLVTQLGNVRKQMEMYRIENGVWPFENAARQREAGGQ